MHNAKTPAIESINRVESEAAIGAIPNDITDPISTNSTKIRVANLLNRVNRKTSTLNTYSLKQQFRKNFYLQYTSTHI